MVKSSFDHDRGILNSSFIGDVSVQELIDYIDATRENRSYPRVLKILTDATQAQMNFPASALTRVVEANFRSLQEYEYIIDAIIIDSPRETAIGMFYQELAKTNKYKFEIFSSRDSAMTWLLEQ